jgi:hypothetical protein
MNTRRLALVALVVAAGLGLAGCAAAGSPSPAASAAQGARGNGFGGGQGGFAGGAFPGASGLVAAVNGTTAQVQSATRQTAVTWTASTTFTNQVSASSSDLKTGDCVVARPSAGTRANGGSGGSGTGGSAPTTVAAATIEMSAPVNGACNIGFAGNRQGTRPSGAPTAAPGTGSGNGSTRTPRGGFGGFGAIGTITSLSDGSLVVAETRGGSTQNVTVTYGSSTTFTKLQAGAASDVVVGVCVLAQGKTDDTGALTASTIAVSPAVNGACTTGFGGRGGPGGGATPGTGTGGKNA